MWAEATDQLVALAELLNVPVMTTLAGKSAFPENHALALGTGGHTGTLMVDRFLQKTDFVLGVGTSFTISVFNAPMPDRAVLAQVTNCAEDLNKDYRIDLGAIGDARIVLEQIIEEVRRQLGADGRGDGGVAAEIAAIRAEFNAAWAPRFRSDEVPINPYRVFAELARAVDVPNTIITHDSGYPRDQLVPFWRPQVPRGYIGWGKSTQLGYGLGLALGAKLAAPDKQVINVMGDAAFGMAGLDIETAVRAEIPILTVVLNNGVMTHYDQHMPYASEHWQSNQLGGHYAQVAEALGAHSERVETDLAPAIQRALAANLEGRAALLEVMTKAEENVAGEGIMIFFAGFLFLLSGAAALAYEVVWVKLLTLQFGSAAWSISTVVASFMAGLGAGGAWAGRRADRIQRPLRAYALLELGIALFGMISVPLLKNIPRVLDPLYKLTDGYFALFACSNSCSRLPCWRCRRFSWVLPFPCSLWRSPRRRRSAGASRSSTESIPSAQRSVRSSPDSSFFPSSGFPPRSGSQSSRVF